MAARVHRLQRRAGGPARPAVRLRPSPERRQRRQHQARSCALPEDLHAFPDPQRAVQSHQRVGPHRQRRDGGALAARIDPAVRAAPAGRASRHAAEPGGSREHRLFTSRADGYGRNNKVGRGRRAGRGDRPARPAGRQHRRRRAHGDDEHLRPCAPATQLRAARPGRGRYPGPGRAARRISLISRRPRRSSSTSRPSPRCPSARGSRRTSAGTAGGSPGQATPTARCRPSRCRPGRTPRCR